MSGSPTTRQLSQNHKRLLSVPFFFILPVWVFCVLIGANSLVLSRSAENRLFRDRSSYRGHARIVCTIDIGALSCATRRARISPAVIRYRSYYRVPHCARGGRAAWRTAAFLLLVKLPTRKRV
jgi:hypothetical protein